MTKIRSASEARSNSRMPSRPSAITIIWRARRVARLQPALAPPAARCDRRRAITASARSEVRSSVSKIGVGSRHAGALDAKHLAPEEAAQRRAVVDRAIRRRGSAALQFVHQFRMAQQLIAEILAVLENIHHRARPASASAVQAASATRDWPNTFSRKCSKRSRPRCRFSARESRPIAARARPGSASGCSAPAMAAPHPEAASAASASDHRPACSTSASAPESRAS